MKKIKKMKKNIFLQAKVIRTDTVLGIALLMLTIGILIGHLMGDVEEHFYPYPAPENYNQTIIMAGVILGGLALVFHGPALVKVEDTYNLSDRK